MASDGRAFLVGSRVAAGFPSPADDHLEGALSLDRRLIPHPASTFFVRAQGESMIDAGILDGALLVVDRAKTPRQGAVVIAVVDGDLTVKRWYREKNGVRLAAANPAYPDIHVTAEQDLVLWGVVTAAINELDVP